MPYRPQKPCRHTGCEKLIAYNEIFCPEHKLLHPEYRESAAKRGYGSKWRRISKQYLHEHPLCVECKKSGRYVQATVVDHIVPHRGNESLFWNKNNWQSLCKQCHDKKTGRFDSDVTPKS